MIETAHNCVVLGIPFEARLFTEPPGDYLLALQIVAERVSQTNEAERRKVEARS